MYWKLLHLQLYNMLAIHHLNMVQLESCLREVWLSLWLLFNLLIWNKPRRPNELQCSELTGGVINVNNDMLFQYQSQVLVCRWLAVLRDMEWMHVLHHRRLHRVETSSSRSLFHLFYFIDRSALSVSISLHLLPINCTFFIHLITSSFSVYRTAASWWYEWMNEMPFLWKIIAK